MLGRPEAQSTFRTPGPIARSLTQTRQVLEFKCTKTEEPRPISLPVSAIAALDDHRKVQDEFRHQYGPDYRARRSSPTQSQPRCHCYFAG
jgi:hypothetical protein